MNRVLFGFLFLVASSTFAGPRDTGGGHSVQMPDGSWVLADRFAADLTNPFGEIEGVEYHLSTDLVSDIHRAIRVLTRSYAADKAEDFAKMEIFDTDVRFILVNELPLHPACNEDPTLPNLPPELAVKQAACTVQMMTLIRADVFAKLPQNEKVKLIIHERLRNWNKGQPLIVVASITNGLGFALDLITQQAHGEHFQLSSSEVGVLRNLLMAINRSGLGTRENLHKIYRVAQNGGGLENLVDYCSTNCNQHLRPGSVLGAGSIIIGDTVLAEGAQVFESTLRLEQGSIPPGIMIRGSNLAIWKLKTEPGASILNSDVEVYSLGLASGALIQDSMIDGRGYTLDNKKQEGQPLRSVTEMTLGKNAKVFSSVLNGRILDNPIILADEASLNQVNLVFGSTEPYEKSVFSYVKKADFSLAKTSLKLDTGSSLSHVAKSFVFGSERRCSDFAWITGCKYESPYFEVQKGSKLDFQDMPMNAYCPAGTEINFVGRIIVSTIDDLKNPGNLCQPIRW